VHPRALVGSRRLAWVTLVAWFVVVVAGVAAAPTVFAALGDAGSRRDTESGRATRLLAGTGRPGARLVGVVEVPVADAAATAGVRLAAADLRRTPGVAAVLDLPDSGAAPLAADDGSAQLIVADLAPGLPPEAFARVLAAVQDRLHAIPAARVLVGGGPLITRQANRAAARDLVRAEAVTLPLALLAMVVVFGGLLAAVLPVLTAVGTVGAALLALLGLVRVLPVDSNAVNVVTMFGLGLAIDYGLLMLTRFREERAAGAEPQEAVRRAGATAGRTITFSAATVAAALCGLLAFGDPALTSLAVGGIAATGGAVLAGRTLLPTLLTLLGSRIPPGRVAADAGGFARLARAVARRPVLVAAAGVAVLALCAAPVLHTSLRHADYHVLPRGSEARQAAEALDRSFPGRADSPVTVLVTAPRGDPGVAAYLAGLPSLPGVLRAVPRDTPPSLAAVDLFVGGDAQGEGAQRLVRAVRAARPASPPVLVTGDAAYLIDHRSALAARLPLAVALVAGTTLLLVFLLTGSVVLPLKAVGVAALSLAASLGVLVWGFQEGHLAGLLGFASPPSLQLEVPLIVLVFAYGLSLDYEIFLLGRITEAHRAGADAQAAVALGLQRTGRVITSAALLIVLVFLGFAAGDVLLVQQLGVGLAVAVVLDATVVRCLLVPAAMALLGRRNWWAPAPLARLHARLGLAGAPPPPMPGAHPGATRPPFGDAPDGAASTAAASVS